MSARLEMFLAKLYVDGDLRRRFFRDPEDAARHAGLSEWECSEVAKIPALDLERASGSFERKREVKQRHLRAGNVRNVWHRLRKAIGRE
jgi:hypothetical protein